MKSRPPPNPWTIKTMELLNDRKEHSLREIYDYVEGVIPDEVALSQKYSGKKKATHEQKVAAGKKYIIVNYLSRLVRSHSCVATGGSKYKNWVRIYRFL
jgi:hypothetical protein